MHVTIIALLTPRIIPRGVCFPPPFGGSWLQSFCTMQTRPRLVGIVDAATKNLVWPLRHIIDGLQWSMKVTPILSTQSERQDNALASLTKDLVQNQGAILRASKLGERLDPAKLSLFNEKLEPFFDEKLGAVLLDGGELAS